MSQNNSMSEIASSTFHSEASPEAVALAYEVLKNRASVEATQPADELAPAPETSAPDVSLEEAAAPEEAAASVEAASERAAAPEEATPEEAATQSVDELAPAPVAS